MALTINNLVGFGVQNLVLEPIGFSSGELASSGSNGSGQLGVGDENDRELFTQEATNANDWSIISRDDGVLAVINTLGELWLCGSNAVGQLGVGDNTARSTLTQESLGKTDWVYVLAGGSSTFAIDTLGDLYGTGSNQAGKLGVGDFANRNQFTQTNLNNVVKVETQAAGTVARTSNNRMYSSGNNISGGLGLGATSDVQSFTREDTSRTDIADISMSVVNTSTRVLTSGGEIYSTGFNAAGQLAVGDTTNRIVLTQEVLTNTNWTQISSSSDSGTNPPISVCALNSLDEIFMAGENDDGQLAVGDLSGRSTLTQESSSATDWGDILMAGTYATVLKTDGTMHSSGRNYGQFGTGGLANTNIFVAESTGKVWASFGAGDSSTGDGEGIVSGLIAGDMFGAGSNGLGGLGLGDDLPRTLFSQVIVTNTWVSFGISSNNISAIAA